MKTMSGQQLTPRSIVARPSTIVVGKLSAAAAASAAARFEEEKFW